MSSSSDDEDGEDFRTRAMAVYKMAGSKQEVAAAANTAKSSMKGDSKEREKAEYRKMAMALYNQEPGSDDEKAKKIRQKLASKARKLKETILEERPEDAPPPPPTIDGDSDDLSSSDEDEETKQRRQRDREAQRAKAKKIKRFDVNDGAEVVKSAFTGLFSKGKAMMKAIKNEDEEQKLDGQGEQQAFIDKRRRILAELGGDTASVRPGQERETEKNTKWERDFIMMARRKRTIVNVCAFLLLGVVIGLPPAIIHMLDMGCQEPSETKSMPFAFEVQNLQQIQVENFRGSVSIDSSPGASNTVVVEMDVKAVSEDSLAAILVTAGLEDVEHVGSVLKVNTAYDDATGGDFGLWSCPSVDITIRLPEFTYDNLRLFGPALNVTVDGPVAEPVVYPWIPNLVRVLGEVTITLNSSRVLGGALVVNKLANVSLMGYTGKPVSVFTTVGGITLRDSKLPAVELISENGNIEATATQLVPLEELTAESVELMTRPSQGGVALLPALASLGYARRGRLYALSSAGDVNIDGVTDGDVEARSGTGDVVVSLSSLGFSGFFELTAPFATQNAGFSTMVVEHRLADVVGIDENRRAALLPELSSLYYNSTFMTEKLVLFDDNPDPLTRVGRVVLHDGVRHRGQRLMAETDAGDLKFILHEEVENRTLMMKLIT